MGVGLVMEKDEGEEGFGWFWVWIDDGVIDWNGGEQVWKENARPGWWLLINLNVLVASRVVWAELRTFSGFSGQGNTLSPNRCGAFRTSHLREGGSHRTSPTHDALQLGVPPSSPKFLLPLLNAWPHFPVFNQVVSGFSPSVYLFTKNQTSTSRAVSDVGCVQPRARHWQGHKTRFGENIRVCLHATTFNMSSPSKNPFGISHPGLSNSFLTWHLFPACTTSWVTSSIAWFPFILWLSDWRWKDFFTCYSQTTRLGSYYS